jgi:hypothetical protein
MAEKQQMIDTDPKYGHVFCRCEQVTEAEILQSIRRGAHTMDAVHPGRYGSLPGGILRPFRFEATCK